MDRFSHLGTEELANILPDELYIFRSNSAYFNILIFKKITFCLESYVQPRANISLTLTKHFNLESKLLRKIYVSLVIAF